MSTAQSYTIHAALLPTPQPLTVEQFTPGRTTPGDVGLCFSGGGTFALVAALGQMRGLRHLGLLGQARAISSVSGGSWATVPFTYLPDTISDDDFLGGFVEDPASLTLRGWLHPHKAEVLDYLTPHNLGRVPASLEMSAVALGVEAMGLLSEGVPLNRVWTHLIGKNVLGPFGLSSFDENHLPQSFFAYDARAAEAILAANPQLPRLHHLYHRAPGDTDRPLHVCNTAMFITASPTSGEPKGVRRLAPVQATAFYTGILSTGLGTDAGDHPVGGGGVSSFAFNSLLTELHERRVTARQDAPLALSDITGMSSAFYASLLGEAHPALRGLDPKYDCWPASVARAPCGSRNQFADGGAVEDNGVSSILAFTDIRRLVVFMNTPGSPIRKDGDDIVIDRWLPTLFGYRPHGKEGYRLYSESPPSETDGDRFFQYNQVFESSRFDEVLNGLWESSGKGESSAPAVFLQKGLTVLDNPWFGVHGAGRTIDVLWVKVNPVTTWQERLQPDVRAKVSADFPAFDLMQTHLSVVDTNLFAHFTSWIVNQRAEAFRSLFSSGSAV